MKASSLVDHKATITLEWFGEHAACVVRPGRLTTQLIQDIQDLDESGGNASRALLEAVCGLVVEWGIEEDDGAAWPVDVEHAGRLPVGLLAQIVEKTREAPSKAGKA